MKFYCLEKFRDEYYKLLSKKQYKELKNDLIHHFKDKDGASLASGRRLNPCSDNTPPYIKKRISGSGGYRIYYYLIIKDKKVYLGFIHPKTGPLGTDNITKEKQTEIINDILDAIKNEKLLEVTFEEKEITFR